MAAVTAVTTAATVLSGPPSQASPAHREVVSATPSSSTPHAVDDAVVPNAAVNAFAQAGSTMYAGGKFHTVLNAPRSVEYVRDNLFSFDAGTGAVSKWRPDVDGEVRQVLHVAPYLYVGGAFRNADGVASRLVRYRVDTREPQIDPTWKPSGTAGVVTDLDYVDGRLIVAGSFKKRLIALDPETGRDTRYIALDIAGTVKADGAGPTAVHRFAVSPDGTKLVAIGNFATVTGQARQRAFMAHLGSASASLAPWYYEHLANACRAKAQAAQLRDVDFDPTGSYFVIVATGYIPATNAGIGRDLCDAAARFETSVADPYRPTWFNYTGGDTLHSVAVTGAAVYVGGHQRWADNPFGKNTAGPGAVPRMGVAALDPASGDALDWNPGKTRGVGTKVIYATPAGVWFGSDGRRFAGKIHDSIAFTPLP